ncbi:MAG: SufE family protein [Flavobacteriales bacterium]|nr:SufE family protein [Flavobacteriales bacterium]NNK81431.1 SufE family protein [Flavobacteriales bacterium]
MDLIEERQRDIIEEFSMFDDWMDKYSLIIDMAKDLEPLPDSDRIDDNLIKGCQSKVWLTADNDGEKVHFHADSDAIITKGLVSLMISVLSDASHEDIMKADLHFIDDIGLQEHLSPTRSNGLAAMVKQMKMYALALSAK